MTNKVAEFKRQLRDLVDQAKAAGAGKAEALAREAHVDGSTVSKAIGQNHRLPTREITRDLVAVCLRYIHPDIPPDQLEKSLRWWLNRREDADRHARSSRMDDNSLPLHTLADVVRKIADARSAVVSVLSIYRDRAEQVQKFEKAFDEQILRRRSDLELRRGQRERLEAGYRDIQLKVHNGGLDADGVEKEVAAVLESSDLVYTALIGGVSVRALGDTTIGSFGFDDYDLDKATKDRIRRNFKSIVFGYVHPDLPHSDSSDFYIALDLLRSCDYTLMEAFTIKYHYNVGADKHKKPLTEAELANRLDEYEDALKRLENRLSALERDAVSIGLNAPEAAYYGMRREADRILMEIKAEADRIYVLECELQSLVQSAPDTDDGPELPDTDLSYTPVPTAGGDCGGGSDE